MDLSYCAVKSLLFSCRLLQQRRFLLPKSHPLQLKQSQRQLLRRKAAVKRENFFKEAGEVADVRFALDADQRFKGFGHVEFTTAEAAQKALNFNGKSLLGREVRLDLARERGERSSNTPYSKDNNSYQKGGGGQSQTIFVKGFDKFGGEDEVMMLSIVVALRF
ncbi:hypothetical protein DKX38_004374 [Salix brachista]|uniref:RRM domain-containing protein n=1 Tax=Salix brachista TaxID=2182728 RepID=A0A5N5N9T7_9ROSI|nr:hypothetical protein DKX38_004374 [Salix brachista]